VLEPLAANVAPPDVGTDAIGEAEGRVECEDTFGTIGGRHENQAHGPTPSISKCDNMMLPFSREVQQMRMLPPSRAIAIG
jgi:hypothetical protein